MTSCGPDDSPPEREVLVGARVRLRRATIGDVDRMVAIRAEPEVFKRWAGDDLRREVVDDVSSDDLTLYVIEGDDRQVIGGIQWHEEADPMYRHAGLGRVL